MAKDVYVYEGPPWELNGRVYTFGMTVPLTRAQAEQFARLGHAIRVQGSDTALAQQTVVSDVTLAAEAAAVANKGQ